MTLPPMVLKVSVQNRRKRGFTLWIPLFIVVPFLLVIFILLLPLLLVAAVLAVVVLVGRGRGGHLPRMTLLALLALPRFFAIFWALRGFLVDVRSKSEHVFFSIR